ncbi:cysteine/histidine-rich C1 domain family protein [Actinidia rufa]|uniref:Cysteine/histidine-rich C1 domain family protein n=1 Tax=Actinidia rufa TaxID=165716 RepID=A0A7J0ETY3_9ERIC|nr:cysteine/histidine-rich C1 domain family protein [Actinidia rufa]
MKYNEISHFSHPQHKLKFEYTEALFKCDGCKEVGIGSRYRCATCDYDLHMHCALPTPTLSHPFYTKCSFQFHPRPPGPTPRYCNACEKDITGFLYHCKDCGFDLHPCCAKLPVVLSDDDVKLYLYRKVSAPCHRCGRKGRSWSYRSSCKKYNLHVACVKEMLVESWHEMGCTAGRGGSNRKLETRIPSLKVTLLQNHPKKSKSKVKKGCEMAALAIQFVVAAVLGDPTTLIAGVVGALISK